MGTLAVRALALALWSFAVWLLLTWTATAEQLIFGAVLSLICGVVLAPFGTAVGPWALLRPRRLWWSFVLVAVAAREIVRANLGLARRIWSPRLPLASGMVIVPTDATSDAELAALGLLTSLVVDNQLVDLDRSRHVLQYHAVAVPADRRSITSKIEPLVLKVTRR